MFISRPAVVLATLAHQAETMMAIVVHLVTLSVVSHKHRQLKAKPWGHNTAVGGNRQVQIKGV